MNDSMLTRSRHEAPSLADDTADRLIATAIARGERQRTRRRWYAAGGLTTVFGVVIVLVGPNEPRVTQSVPQFEVMATVGASHTVRVVYDSEADRPTAKISVGLPRNLEVAGHPMVRDLSWTTSLRKGKNLLELPVILTDESDALLTVAFDSEGGSKEVRLLMRAASAVQTDASSLPHESPRRIS